MRRLSLLALLAAHSTLACASGAAPSTSGGGQGQGGQGGGQGAAGAGGQAGGGGELPLACVTADGASTPSDTWADDAYQASVSIAQKDSCARVYTLTTNAPLRDGQPENPRTFGELGGQPVLRTGHDLFDALYALAHDEVRQCSVDAIEDGAFNDGQPLPCPPGGCFETGRLWTYVWTRDTSYAADLGLASVDPTRTANSLGLKVSTKRDGGELQIVQDTGTGGSYPVSTDRAVWALGALAVLRELSGAEREAFKSMAWLAMQNTVLRDREVAFDASDGLYRGEQSFLDWREQTYPGWTASDPAQIAMSKALGTNVTHLVLLEATAKLAAEVGDQAAATTYSGWASALRQAITDRLWLPEEGQLSTFVTTTLDPSAVRRFDLLGSSLAVLFDVVTGADAASVISGYPLLPKGPAVVWPQQQDTPIYHNRGIWPFVTAYWLRAAKKVENAAAVSHGVRSLVRGSALNLSNMENFEAVTGLAWLDDGPASGPVVNSQRQLWSVAGYLSMVHDVLFGLERTDDGLRVRPFVPRELRASLFSGTSTLALTGVRYQGKRLTVVLHLPPVAGTDGHYDVGEVTVNGATAAGELLTGLEDGDRVDVTLLEGPASSPPITLLSTSDIADYRNVFGPKVPGLVSLGLVGDRLSLELSTGGESPADVTFSIYRDGVRVADDLPGSTTSWVDEGSAAHATTSYCYSVETTFVASGNHSQHAAPLCYWGPGYERVQVEDAQAFASTGGELVFEHGKWHYQGWGAPDDTLSVAMTPAATGRYLVQLDAGNGAGPVNTGITCGVKAVEVWSGGSLVTSGQVLMPQLGTWDAWRGSTFLPVELVGGTPYVIVVREDERSGNMSDLEHFALYGGMGGKGGRFNDVNVSEVKLLYLGP
jgi:hypothetical protein